MKSRTLLALVAAIVVLVALAFAVSVSQRPDESGGGLLLPGLKAQINDVGRIVVRGGGDKTIATLKRDEDGWVVSERYDYPADVGRIRKNLIALSEARKLEEKTANPELYDRLKVEDIEKPNAGGVRLDLDAGGKATSVIIGETGVGGGDRAYARRPGEEKSWLVSGAFELSPETGDWLDRHVTDIAASRVHTVTIIRPNGPTLTVEKATAEGTDFTVQGVPAGRDLAFPGVGNAIGAALAGLSFDSVEPLAGFSPGDAKPVVARFETFDGLVVEASTWRLPGGARVRFSAKADEALAQRLAPPAPASGPTSGTETKPTNASGAEAKPATAAARAEPQRKSFAEVGTEAAQLQARLASWVYTLPEYKVEQLTKKPEDLLQPKTKKKPAP